MPFAYSGNPTGVQSPSPQPAGGGVPILNIPVTGDRGPDLWVQPLKAAADWIAFLAAQPLAIPSGQLLRTSVLTSGVSLATFAGCRRARVRLVGGGGGGAGAGSSTSQDAGGGGAAGGYAEFFTGTVPAAWAFTIGAGGAAGSFIPGDGGNGGSTTFSDGATTVTAFGGGGGKTHSRPGSAPSLSTNGTINGSGEPGGGGDSVFSGRGGSSLLGGGGGGPVSTFGFTSSAANNGVGFGAGGSGAAVVSAFLAGGVGTGGAIILEEYS